MKKLLYALVILVILSISGGAYPGWYYGAGAAGGPDTWYYISTETGSGSLGIPGNANHWGTVTIAQGGTATYLRLNAGTIGGSPSYSITLGLFDSSGNKLTECDMEVPDTGFEDCAISQSVTAQNYIIGIVAADAQAPMNVGVYETGDTACSEDTSDVTYELNDPVTGGWGEGCLYLGVYVD